VSTSNGSGITNVSFTSTGGGGGGGGGSGNANVTVTSSIPTGARANQDFWWDTDTGMLKIYYNDGDTSQWVDAVTRLAGPQGPSGPTSEIGFQFLLAGM
jgi:hypothetical protein